MTEESCAWSNKEARTKSRARRSRTGGLIIARLHLSPNWMAVNKNSKQLAFYHTVIQPSCPILLSCHPALLPSFYPSILPSISCPHRVTRCNSNYYKDIPTYVCVSMTEDVCVSVCVWVGVMVFPAPVRPVCCCCRSCLLCYCTRLRAANCQLRICQ